MHEETGHVTGTKDKDYNLLWYVEACLGNALRLETYVEDAEREGDGEVAELFRKAQADSRKGAEMGKRLLASRLSANGTGTGGDAGAGTPVRAAGDALTGTGEGAATVPGAGAAAGGPSWADDRGALRQDPMAP